MNPANRGIDWMYQGSAGAVAVEEEQKKADAEAYLMGKEYNRSNVKTGDLASATAGSDSVGMSKVIGSAVNMATTSTARKYLDNGNFQLMHEDPMFMVNETRKGKERDLRKKKELFEKATGKIHGRNKERLVDNIKSEKKRSSKREKRSRRRDRSSSLSSYDCHDDRRSGSHSHHHRKKRKKEKKSKKHRHHSYSSEDEEYKKRHYKRNKRRERSHSQSSRSSSSQDRDGKVEAEDYSSRRYDHRRHHRRDRHRNDRSRSSIRSRSASRDRHTLRQKNDRNHNQRVGDNDNDNRRQNDNYDPSHSSSPSSPSASSNAKSESKKYGLIGSSSNSNKKDCKDSNSSSNLGPDQNLIAKKRQEKEEARSRYKRNRYNNDHNGTNERSRSKSTILDEERQAAILQMQSDANDRSIYLSKASNVQKVDLHDEEIQRRMKDRSSSDNGVNNTTFVQELIKSHEPSMAVRVAQNRNKVQRPADDNFL
mmetsp:Transcript_12249/g.14244  ORF Transcript_12249/g.14244 Transcript_12249/m.14244 type:complete len:480 (-) Transcript_12249:52-1491(-)